VVDADGNAYVNNTGFDFPGAEFAPGSIVLVAPDGEARQVADGVAFPNGMAITPDGRTLVVAESYANRLTAFAIGEDGGLSGRRVWAELDGGYPDGICIDADGAVWYADVPNRCCVRVREGGEVLAEVRLDRGCFACMLGGDDGRTLFVTANEWGGTESMSDGRTGQVVAVEAPSPHAGRP
jgi:sugar lactone lactonase YvrE